MSFSEDCVRLGDQLARLVDAGVPVKEAAVVIGVSRERCYAILRAIGRPVGSARGQRAVADRDVIVAVFQDSGSILQAAKACGVSHSTARKMLVAEGLVTSEKIPWGKPEAKRRCVELFEQGWSTERAAREVGVNVRTARDWRKGIRHVNNTRIHSDGLVVDYTKKTVYKQPVSNLICDDTGRPAIGDRYLSVQDRVAIADGMLGKQSLRTIANAANAHALAAVYAPIGFLGGLTGSLFREFAFTLAGSVIVSGVIALTLSPMMCSVFLKNAEEGRFAKLVNRVFGAMTRWYGRKLDRSLDYKPVTLMFAAAILGLVGFLFGWAYQGVTFDLALHFGTLMAVLVYYRRDLTAIATAMLTRDRSEQGRAQRQIEQSREIRTDLRVERISEDGGGNDGHVGAGLRQHQQIRQPGRRPYRGVRIAAGARNRGRRFGHP